MNDPLQASLHHEHFDGYDMEAFTETRFQPSKHIPGQAIKGWPDAEHLEIVINEAVIQKKSLYRA